MTPKEAEYHTFFTEVYKNIKLQNAIVQAIRHGKFVEPLALLGLTCGLAPDPKMVSNYVSKMDRYCDPLIKGYLAKLESLNKIIIDNYLKSSNILELVRDNNTQFRRVVDDIEFVLTINWTLDFEVDDLS